VAPTAVGYDGGGGTGGGCGGGGGGGGGGGATDRYFAAVADVSRICLPLSANSVETAVITSVRN